MAIDREKLLFSAAKFAEKKKYDKAVAEYQRILESEPNDTRTMLKVGDLQSRMSNFSAAIVTYNTVAESYARDGFFLKAIAVYKQIRELLRKHAPELAPRYAHVTPRLAEIYAKLNLTSDALAAYDEVATALQQAGQDRDAVEIFQKTVELDPKNPLPHLRLAEANCKVQEIDAAIDSFWRAAELLLSLDRPDDALKVIERILHFRRDARFARAAAELYIKKNEHQAGMQALAKLQIAFQADPKDLQTLSLLAQAFEVIEQPEKALAVHIEMARLAREQNRVDLWQQILAHLTSVAPTHADVIALTKAGPPQPSTAQPGPAQPPSAAPPEAEPVELDVEPEPDSSPAPPAASPLSSDWRANNASYEAEAVDLDADLEYIDDSEAVAASAGQRETAVGAEPEAPQAFVASAHAHKAIVDAESFRRLGLLDKAVEALHIALEVDPNSVPIREKLREILVDAGERDSAIQETINIAIIHLHNQQPDLAEPLALEVLEIEPEHQDAQTVLYHVGIQRQAQEETRSASGHLHSFDLEGVRPSSALGQVPPDAPLPSFPLDDVEPAAAGPRPSPEAIEEVLEEAEFFAAQGLFIDAEAILQDTLLHAPGHTLLLERLAEVQQAKAASEGKHRGSVSSLGPPDNSFDIAASLDALDELDASNVPQLAPPGEEIDVDQVFAKFKEGVKATVDDGDSATHYDLGVAYKEMGLLADAIFELKLASRDPARACNCHAMVAQLHQQTGDLNESVAALELALASDKTSDQHKGLLYELALVLEELDDSPQYARRLKELARMDPHYRDVAERLSKLRTSGTSPSEPPDDDLEAAFDHLLG